MAFPLLFHFLSLYFSYVCCYLLFIISFADCGQSQQSVEIVNTNSLNRNNENMWLWFQLLQYFINYQTVVAEGNDEDRAHFIHSWSSVSDFQTCQTASCSLWDAAVVPGFSCFLCAQRVINMLRQFVSYACVCPRDVTTLVRTLDCDHLRPACLPECPPVSLSVSTRNSRIGMTALWVINLPSSETVKHIFSQLGKESAERW